MKKLIAGAAAVVSSVILYGLTRVSAAIYALYLTQPNVGWNTDSGPFGTAMRAVGTVPLIIAVLLFVVGACLVVAGIREGK
ncbi:phosphatase [Alicyclobacillus cycloheptanicus]|uniref:Uncharacterized protein n=1 Tax=Alicyclobacillus cycloheptanicus TaxID=1457 RepID=A0ABT9XLZ1_9BACL|nr:phosphatase [Alicyclobacillus cycloheptanicus]MDQ0191335.1 hypothetical protein [Alicyclobacillus cycloheptanicus]WDM00804.1 phosphatase [Alicyclobacillus cycloheptanicus]